MRYEQIAVYKYDELSDKAKERALSDNNQYDDSYPWGSENEGSLKAFSDIFNVKVKDWGYGYRNHITFTIDHDEKILELSGLRLHKYIWNNYRTSLYKGKYFSTTGKYIDGKYYYRCRHSKILLENCCVMTGYCMDDDILQPIYDFLKKPSDKSFEEILSDGLWSWVFACNKEYEYSQSMEYFGEICKANDYEFYVDGRMV